jgi:undecaprenyl-diphosphatase
LGHDKGEIESLFKELPLVAAALFVVGIIILWSGLLEDRIKERPLTPWTAFWIGLIQAICLPFRGFSRSGATISMALFRGVPRRLAEDFSFALAVVLTPPAIWRLFDRLRHAPTSEGSPALLDQFLPGLVGMGSSFIAGLVALKFLSAALDRGKWKYFGYYCIVASAVVLGLSFYFDR